MSLSLYSSFITSKPDLYEDECCHSITYIHEGLTFLCTNADNFINKMHELRAKVVVTNPDIMIITEVYPKTGDSTEIHVLPVKLIGYICFRSFVIKSGRGVVIYVKDLISAERRNDLTLLYEYGVLIQRYFCGRERATN